MAGLMGPFQGQGLRKLMQPEYALPIAGALMSGRGNQDSFGRGLQMAGFASQQMREDEKLEAEERKAAQQRNMTMRYLQQNRPDLAAQVEAGLPVGDAFRLLNAPAPERRIITGADNHKYYEDGTRVLPGVDATNKGMRLTMPDGTVFEQGSLGKPETKNQATTLKEAQDAAASGAQLKQTTQILRKANENTGYSGVGGRLVGRALDFGEQMGVDLPGDPGSRAIMESGGLDVALEKVSKTKGAISNAEMNLFMSASPGLQKTPEGNAAILDMIDAIADRQVMRATELERWVGQTGSTRGFEEAWNKYINENPLIVEGQNGLPTLAGAGGADNDPLGIR